MALTPTGWQTVGPYLHIGLTWLNTTKLATEATRGERIVIEGRLFDGDGAPVPDGMLEIWQANADGRYDHPDDVQAKPLDPAFFGFGRVDTAKDGGFRFETIKPGRVPGPGNALQAPHILVSVMLRGQLRRLVSRIYFADEAANAEDPILALVDDPARRRTLMAARQPGKDACYRWDIHLQGDQETVFFDL
jgi:protocatechuate 3,4-dioxygenase alpha subunit